MKKLLYITLIAGGLTACDEKDPDVEPRDENYPFRLVLDTDEGADLATAEDYGLKVAFADHLGDLPSQPITLTYSFFSQEGSFSNVEIDEIIYTVELGDCEYEREIEFNGNEIMIPVDEDMGTVPEEFEMVFALPGQDDAEGEFSFELTSISSAADVLINQSAFTYEVLDSELAGEWVITLNETEFEDFKSFFSLINEDLSEVGYEDFEDGEIAVGFEFEEMKFEIELFEEEEVCENGEVEMEAKIVEIEFEWDTDEDDKEIEFEGSREFDDDGITTELDVMAEATYEINGNELTLNFTRIIDEDNWEEGEELFTGQQSFLLVKDN